MALTSYNLKLLKYLQENNSVHINKISKHFNKNTATIRKNIYHLNKYLPKNKSLIIKNGYILHSLSYNNVNDFIKELNMNNYSLNKYERIHYIIIKTFFYENINLTRVYEDLGLSLTTKKKDTKFLKEYLEEKELSVKIIHKKGITIVGNELKFRILVMQILIPLFEIDENYNILPRKANTPLDNLIVEILLNNYKDVKKFSQIYLTEFLNKYSRNLTYSSKKFLLIYTAVAILRKGNNKINTFYNIQLSSLNLNYFLDTYENAALNQITTMLDFYPSLEFPTNKLLDTEVNNFLTKIQNNIKTILYTRNEIKKEIYNYLYKEIVSKTYNYSFKDKLVKDTHFKFFVLYNLVKKYSSEIEESFNVNFDDEQYLTITLILRKWINKNKVFGHNMKKIIIVTNTYFERIQYFIEALKNKVEVEIIKIFDINEINLIKNIEFDYIITFSDRIHDIVTSLNYNSIKMEYFFNDNDINKLIDLGFSRTNFKFLKSDFSKKLANKSTNEIEKILSDEYDDFFI